MPASPELLPIIDARTFPISPNINAAAAATQIPVPIFTIFFFTDNPPSLFNLPTNPIDMFLF